MNVINFEGENYQVNRVMSLHNAEAMELREEWQDWLDADLNVVFDTHLGPKIAFLNYIKDAEIVEENA